MIDEKDIIKDFSKMIDDLCGPNKEEVNLSKKRDHFRESLIRMEQRYDEYFRWEEEKRKEESSFKQELQCECGEEYVVYLKPQYISFPGTDLTVEVTMSNFYCHKCGRIYRAPGEILKIKSRQLEVVL